MRVGDYAWHVPNGIWLPSSDRVLAAKVMSKLRSRGLKKGVSDITIALPVGRWHGGYFELKRPKDGRLTQEQRKFLDRMADVGYFTAECVGLDAFQKSVTEFLASGKEA